MILTVPHDTERYPTLGPLVVDWMQRNLVFGPGDLRGEPLELDAEQQGFIYRMYEIMPKGHPEEGRRRFTRCGLSLAKGLRKTELLAFIAAAELHPDAPVRFDRWDKHGRPQGKPVNDPVVLLVATTEEQSDDLAYGVLRTILSEGPLAEDFDIGLERILRKRGDGKAQSLAGSPSARDGGLTTFVGLDETHHWVLPRMKQAKKTIISNLGKRKISDPWCLETTTAFEPGASSVAQDTMEYAQAIADGKVGDSRLFFYHRQASDKHDLNTEDGAREAVIEASGPSVEWRDISHIMAEWADPDTDRAWWERVWANRLVQAESKAFDVARWKQLAAPRSILPGELITLGFDGALFHDSTGLVATHVETGYQWVVGVWECPYGRTDWEVPTDEVDDAVMAAFERWNVWRLYADPPYWQSWIAKWAGQLGSERVVEWWTNRRTQMKDALEAFKTSTQAGDIAHDGNDALTRHIGNAHKHELNQRDEQGKPLYLIRKERSDSPQKIDLAMAAILSWEARMDAIKAGATNEPVGPGLFL